MENTQFTIELPQTWLQLGLNKEQIQARVQEWLIISLFSEGRIKAASLLGIRRIEFLDLLHKHGIAYIDYSPEEIESELETVNRLSA
jgi:predicted HTH domain antitoxin